MFASIQILALLTLSHKFEKYPWSKLWNPVKIRETSGIQEYPEHKRVQQQHKTGSIYRPERNWQLKEKNGGKGWEGGRDRAG